jgi:hypothetical protein
LDTSRSKTRELSAYCDSAESETPDSTKYKASFSGAVTCYRSVNHSTGTVFKVKQPEKGFDLNEFKYKDLVLLSTKQLNLGGKKDIKEVITQMKDFLELINRDTVILTCVSQVKNGKYDLNDLELKPCSSEKDFLGKDNKGKRCFIYYVAHLAQDLDEYNAIT